MYSRGSLPTGCSGAKETSGNLKDCGVGCGEILLGWRYRAEWRRRQFFPLINIEMEDWSKCWEHKRVSLFVKNKTFFCGVPSEQKVIRKHYNNLSVWTLKGVNFEKKRSWSKIKNQYLENVFFSDPNFISNAMWAFWKYIER